MSPHGETHRRDEDAWWRQLYDDDGTPDLSGAPPDGSLDEHFATVLKAVEEPPPTAAVPGRRGPSVEPGRRRAPQADPVRQSAPPKDIVPDATAAVPAARDQRRAVEEGSGAASPDPGDPASERPDAELPVPRTPAPPPAPRAPVEPPASATPSGATGSGGPSEQDAPPPSAEPAVCEAPRAGPGRTPSESHAAVAPVDPRASVEPPSPATSSESPAPPSPPAFAKPPAAATPATSPAPVPAVLPVADSPSPNSRRAPVPPSHVPPGRPPVRTAGSPGQASASTPADGPPTSLPGTGDEPRPAAPRTPTPGVVYVGDRPPTYEAEPTAWPAADPERLADLVPDTVVDGARYGLLTVRAVSERGDSARYRGAPRTDALLTARFGSGDEALLFLAIAGGTRAAADDGPRAARDACRTIGNAVGRSHLRLAEDIRSGQRGALKAGLRRLAARAYGKLQPDDEPAAPGGGLVASLRCLLLPVDPDCRTRVFFGVGSGGLFRLRDGRWQDLDPDGEEPDVRFRFRASVAQRGDTLLLCSAGLADPLRGSSELSEHIARRWARAEPPPGIAAFLVDAATRVKGYADDRTAVAVWEG